jgi:hypothetical protein
MEAVRSEEDKKLLKKARQKKLLIVVIVTGVLFLCVGIVLGGGLFTQEKTTSVQNGKPLKSASGEKWNNLILGESSVTDLIGQLGEPLKKQLTTEGTVYYFPGQDPSWPKEVLTYQNTIIFAKEHLFSPQNLFSDSSSALKSSPKELYSPASRSGRALYIYQEDGVAILGNKQQNMIYELYHFPPEASQLFLTHIKKDGYSEIKPQEEFFGP